MVLLLGKETINISLVSSESGELRVWLRASGARYSLVLVFGFEVSFVLSP